MPLEMLPTQTREDTLEDTDKNTRVMTEKSPNENKIRFDTAGSERMIIDDIGQVGIGTGSPTQKLEVNGSIKASGLQAATIGYTDGDPAIAIEDGGYLKFNKGVVHSRGVDVGNSCGNYYNRWIKFAETSAVGDVYDTISSIFVVTLCGQGSGDNRSIDGSFIISVKYTADTASPYYRSAGTRLFVDAITSTDLAYTSDTTWSPEDSIFMTMSNGSLTGTVQLWFRSVLKDQRLFVSQLCGTGILNTGVTDPSFITSTGQSWEQGASSATTGPWPEPAGLGQKIYGTWVSKKLANLEITGNTILETSTTPASASASGVTGTISWDSDYVYVCTATNTWKRSALSAW